MDPKRLLDIEPEDATSALGRELLATLQPSTRARDLAWHRLARHGLFAVGASGIASSAAAATGAGSIATAAKVALVMALAAPLIGGGLYLARSNASEPGPSSNRAAGGAIARGDSAPLAMAAPAATPERNAELTPPEPPAGPLPSVRPQSRAAQLLEENRLLREARAAARVEPGRALAALRELDRRFPRGALLQERELVRLTALEASGNRVEGKALAARFLERYPDSPYAARVRTMF